MVALQILVLSVWVRVLVRQLLKSLRLGTFLLLIRPLAQVLISHSLERLLPIGNFRVLVLISFPIYESKPFWRAKVLLFSDICKKKCSFSQKQHSFYHLFIIQRSGSISVIHHPIKCSRDHLATIVYVTIAFFLHFFIIFLARFKKK